MGTGAEVARYTRGLVEEGFFAGQKKWFLRIRPSSLSIDIIILTFVIMEKKRRDRVADPTAVSDDREEAACEASCDGGL